MQHRVKQASRQRNQDNVVEECPEQVLANLAHCRLTQLDRNHYVPKVVFDEHDVACFYSYVSSCANWQKYGKVVHLLGTMIEADGIQGALGDICEIFSPDQQATI